MWDQWVKGGQQLAIDKALEYTTKVLEEHKAAPLPKGASTAMDEIISRREREQAKQHLVAIGAW
jgi:trimethylamine:corrinoid methyltransferase-like protein